MKLSCFIRFQSSLRNQSFQSILWKDQYYLSWDISSTAEE